MFTWIPIYTELAEKLLEYRNRQGELLELSDEMKRQGLQVITFKDKNEKGEEVPLRELDLLTFFAHFNRNLKEENRIRILEFLRDHFALKAPVPSDFHGIPFADLRKAWFFPYAHSRKEGDVDALWDLAAACLKNGPDQIDPSLFQRCLEIKQVGVPKLTMGLFWINPNRYMALDAVMGGYLAKNGIHVKPAKIKTLKEYVDVIDKANKGLSSDYPQLSRDAYLHAKDVPSTGEDLDEGFADLLHKMAKRNNESVDQVVGALFTAEGSDENELTNRIIHLGAVRKILQETPIDLKSLQSTLSKLWVFGTRSDASRQRSFFQSGQAENLICKLIDPSGGDEVDRIDRFISDAIAAGYTDRDAKDTSGAAQFASVLMSAAYPDRYVDYRGRRWNNLFQLVTGEDKSLCRSSSHALKISTAGKFAAALSKTPTFIRHFGEEHALWKIAGLAWSFRDGLFDLDSNQEAIRAVFRGEINDEQESPMMPLNIILYGPPGTGKTWKLRNEYMPRFIEEAAAVSREDYAAKLVETMSWWEVITIVLLDLKSSKVRDIQSHPLMQARISRANNRNPKAAIWAHLQMHTKKECPSVNYTKRYEPLYFWKDKDSVWSIDEALAHEAVPELLEALEKYRNFRPGQGDKIERYAFTTFHQSYSYEDFVEGIKPVMLEDGSMEEVPDALAYEIKPGIFKTMVNRALADSNHDYALIIDEINRGNVANIFGELITLIEEDKREGKKEALSAVLPYSRDSFVVPHNLYIIGAMNTADRSVEALDTALRRRFTFIAVPPEPDRVAQPDNLAVDLKLLLQTINARIEKLLDKDHAIGHSYFMDIAESTEPFAKLRRVFGTKVLPLLEEYFYGDPAKIGMVLGERFVTRNDAAVEWAKGDWGIDDFEERRLYMLQDPLTLNEEDFRSIYE